MAAVYGPMKACSRCNVEKPLSAFEEHYDRRHHPDGLQAVCRECARKNATGGMSWTGTWLAWRNLLSRCDSPKDKDYPRYGGRGIIVCVRWRESYGAFLADMGERPPGATIDRIDYDGPYAPENCRWATITQQNRNKRNNHRLMYAGETLTIAEWSERTAIPWHTLRRRVAVGWSAEKALETPVGESWWRNKKRDGPGGRWVANG